MRLNNLTENCVQKTRHCRDRNLKVIFKINGFIYENTSLPCWTILKTKNRSKIQKLKMFLEEASIA